MPSRLLLIHRDSLNPGSEVRYKEVEQGAARACVTLNCPHPHVALERISGSREVWWVNAFASEEEKQRVIDAYANNRPLTDALARVTKQREGLIAGEVECFANYRPDLSPGAEYEVAGARYFVVTVSKESPSTGAVFEAPDGTLYAFRTAAQREEAEAMAAGAGPGAILFAVRPYWGMPAKDWIAADPGFWKSEF